MSSVSAAAAAQAPVFFPFSTTECDFRGARGLHDDIFTVSEIDEWQLPYIFYHPGRTLERGRHGMKALQRRDSNELFSENSDNDCEDKTGAGCKEVEGLSSCERGPCSSHCKQHQHSDSSPKCTECGKNRTIIARYSEGYGTEEEYVQSDPQGESDADADIEDTDSRLQVAGSLQRISSRKRKRQRIARQDTTESEDDGGRSHRTHRWSLRLSPHRTHNRTILEESVSQVRPLVVCRCNAAQTPAASDAKPQIGKWSLKEWPFSLSFPLFSVLILLPLSISLIIVLFSVLLPLSNT